MAVTPINLARISFNLRAYNLSESIRGSQTSLYDVQNQLSSGYRFVRPSQDPVDAASAISLDNRLDRLGEVKSNIDSVNAVLSQVEAAMQDAIDLVREGHTLAVQSVDDTISSDERESLATVVNSLIDQLVSVGNRQYLNTHLFSGHQNVEPFDHSGDGVLYRGDANRRETIVDTDRSIDTYTIPGVEFFKALTAEVNGVVDLDPQLTAQTRISDLRGATGQGVTLGRIVVRTPNAVSEIDLSGAATVGDVVDQLNAELPAGIQASIGVRGITLTQAPAPVNVTIEDVEGGHTAADLGLGGTFGGAVRLGNDLDPKLTRLTRVTDLMAGAGVNLANGFVIRNGTRTATINLAGVETFEDILNRINDEDLGVWARISDDGRSLDIQSRVSGIDLYIEENGGQAATALGVRSMAGETRVDALNDGVGIGTEPGSDLRVTTADGTNIDVDLDGAQTLQEVIDRMNAAGGANITVALAPQGNGIRIVDNTAGGGTLRVSAQNNATAVQDLGLDTSAVGNTLTGRDVNPLRADSPFTGLLELRSGLQGDDRRLMTTAAQRLERVLKEMQQVQGELASQAQMMSERSSRIEAEETATEIMLSDVRDVDIADAALHFHQLSTALQASLSTARQVMNLSLLDYL